MIGIQVQAVFLFGFVVSKTMTVQVGNFASFATKILPHAPIRF